MKLDKEKLLKQRFWIGLGAFVLFWLIVFIVALFNGDKVGAEEKKVKDAKDKVAKIQESSIKNENYTKLLAKKKEALTKQKDKVWAEAWKGQQNGFMFWPGIRSKAQLENGYFGDPVPDLERADYRNPGVYDAQPIFSEKKLAERLAPVIPKGDAWSSLVKRATWKSEKDPTTEEMWLAQEDLWVQNELLNVVKAALDTCSRFENEAVFKRVEIPEEELKAADKPDEKAAAPAPPAVPPSPEAAAPEAAPKKVTVPRQRFHTPYWQLDLVTERNDKKELTVTPQTKLTNLRADAVPVPGLTITLSQQKVPGAAPVNLTFEGKAGDKLAAGKSLALAKEVPLPGYIVGSMDRPFEDYPLAAEVTADVSEKLPEGALARLRYRNPNWQLDMLAVLDKEGRRVISDKSKIKNICPTKRSLALNTAVFELSQGERGKATITIKGEYLAWGETADFSKTNELGNLDPQKPMELRQVFSWATSPIKRVDALELYANSHRTANLKLVPAKQFASTEEAPKDAAAGGQAGGMQGGMQGGMPSGMPTGGASGAGGGMAAPPGAGIPGAGAGSVADGSKTPNGLVRNRYIAVTDQVRCMPVALEVVIDQAAIQDVLTAVANSRLRIQITQVQWEHVHGIRAGNGGEATVPGNGAGNGDHPTTLPPTGGSSTPPGYGGSGSPKPTGGSGSGIVGPPVIPPGGGRGGDTQPTTGGDPSDPNLVELAVYGIAALYERYPPKAPPAPEGGNAGQAGAPGIPPAPGPAAGTAKQ